MVWQLAQNFGWLVSGIATPPSATAPATRASTRVALGFQFMLRTWMRERKCFDDQGRHAANIIQI